jgi:hypothetical protein
MITFDNQISTGIQAFGHCGSPTCTMTSAFGANPETATPYSDAAEAKRGTSLLIGLAVFSVVASILFTGKLK